MKSLYFITLLIAIPSIQAQENFDTFIPPQKPNPATYRLLWEQSPFTEKEVIVTEEGPGFAENLQLEGIMSRGGEDVACILDITSDEVLYVRASEATKGITLIEVKNRNKIDEASVIIASGSERATLGFSDDKLVVAPITSASVATPKTAGNAQQTNPNDQVNNDALLTNNGQAQQVTAGTPEKTSLNEEQMRERRRQFWESMRDRRSRGGN